MPGSAEFLEKARTFAEMAATASSAKVSAEFLEMAEDWIDLSHLAELAALLKADVDALVTEHFAV